jgi:predicted dehydrogenase
VVIASVTAAHQKDLKEVLTISKDAVILVEKPLFNNYTPDFVITSNKVFIGYNLRFHPVISELKVILSEFKNIYYANFFVGQYLPSWRPDRDYKLSYSAKKEEGGGVLLDLSHEIDLLHWLFGKIEKFSSLVTKHSALEISSEDIALIQGVTDKNIVFSISMDYLSKIVTRRILIHTEEVTIVADLINYTISIADKKGEVNTRLVPKEDRNYSYTQMHSSILFNHCKNVCSIKEGLEINYWIDQIKNQSMVLG